MASVRQLLSMADLDSVLAGSAGRPVLVFKHSTTWPVSANAHGAWAEFLKGAAAAKVDHALVRVIEERPVSLAFAERVDCRHASPQAVLVKDGKAVWSDSHWNITAEALAKAVASV